MEILCPTMNVTTHEDRHLFNDFMVEDCKNVNLFYNLLQRHKFCVSPIGQKEDCYRHLECTAFGCMPIVNGSERLKDLYGNNIILDTTSNMVNNLKYSNTNLYAYEMPNRDMCLTQFWRNRIQNTLTHLDDSKQSLNQNQ